MNGMTVLMTLCAVSAIFSITAGVMIVVMFRNMSVSFADIANKYQDMRRILIDIRDGTKHFYTERRKSIRQRLNFKTLIVPSEKPGFIKTLDISYEGALLETPYRIDPGKVIEIKLYLPLFAQPISVKARVMWSAMDLPLEDGTVLYKTGVSFIGMDDISRKELMETIDILSEGTQ